MDCGIALKRHVHVAEQPSQTITLNRLLTNPSFSAYAIDNARAKVLDEEICEALAKTRIYLSDSSSLEFMDEH